MSATPRLDQAGPIREGEELDIAKVDAWLKERVSLKGTPRVTQYAGGASNWTYRLEYDNDDLILRRPPAGTKAKSAHDMGREYTFQKALAPVFPYVPEMVAHTTDTSIIGVEFYVMKRIPGIIPRATLGVAMDRDQTRQLCLNVIDTLIALHQVNVEANGLSGLGKGTGYARRQITGWIDRYQKARTWNVPKYTQIMTWLENNIPKESATCVVHNDFRFDNVILDPSEPTRVIGVLDWELATLGDPLMDLGNSLAYWVQADDDFFARKTRRQPTHLPGMLTRKEVVNYYCAKMNFSPGNWAFYEVYGLFRLAGILQQINYRYHHRQTRNPAFRHFWLLVNYFHWRCSRIIRETET